MTVKAYSYLRFSSAAQAEGDSLRRQLKAAMEWAAERPEIELDTSARDLGVSAFKGEHRVKGALSSFLARVQNGQIERGSYFLVESFDRLSRENETVAVNLLTSITLAGIKVVTLTDGYVYDDKSDAMDLMRAIIVMSRAHEENKARGRKLAAAWADKKRRARENGEILSRRGPSWTEFNETTKRFDLIEDRAKIIRRIFQEAIDGLGGTAIAARLNADGVEPFVKGSDGWHPGFVLTILKSRSVMGFYQPTFWSKTAGERAVRQHDGEDIPGYYPEVISPELFEKVQGIIHRRNKRGGGSGRRGKAFPNLILGLGRCEVCGGTLVLGNAPNSPTARFFRCYASSRNHRCENKTRYKAAPIEAALEWFLINAQADNEQPSSARVEMVALVDRKAEVERRIAALVDQLELGSSAVAGRLRERELEMVEIDRSISELQKDERAVSHVNRSEAMMQAVQWMRTMKDLTGDELYRARAKANSHLTDVFDWIIPTAKGGIFLGQGDKFRYVEEDLITFPAFLEEGQPITGASLTEIIGEIPALDAA
ncbi:recombinase family protein [Brevundimonas sp. TWP1-2-1b1]|uniref:recombinase family protein n=1 Tax=unclassified Brevundimonas TaxID=2622653 RepID=UPI003CF09A5F